MGDPEPQAPQTQTQQPTQTRSQAATAAIRERSPDAALTFDAIIKIGKGDVQGAAAEMQSERRTPNTGNPVVDGVIVTRRVTAIEDLQHGRTADAIKEAKESLGAQLGADLANQLYADRYGPNANATKAQADLDAIRNFVTNATGDVNKGEAAAAALDRLVEANHQRNEDLVSSNPLKRARATGPGGGIDMNSVIRAANNLGDIVKDATDVALKSGDMPAPGATPAAPRQDQQQGQRR